ncbi:MAG: LPS-assembly protein LptD, partial [Treponema sp.]|nr:LPS-assembly protein LptD [Treponema sp.]
MQKTRMIFGGHSLKFLFFAAVLSFFAVRNVSARDESSERSVINIESAQKTEYKKDSEKGTDTIVLTGNVRISVSRGNKKTTITADTVNYNRANDMLYAEGNVSLEQSSGSSGGESITADSLLFNTSTLEGIFDNGRAVQTSSDAINLPSGSTLIVASDIFGRDSGGTIAFKTGELTFCDDEDPHWKIRASRIWLLPGGEFAFLNATLYVGRIPLLWFPAFYYPKDELVFNPAFGYKARPGYFVNTTTYLYGRKNPSDTSSKSSSSDDDDKINFFSFMKTGAMKEQVREGLVLHNLDEDFTGDTSSYFKVMADYYSNLGSMVGFDGAFKPGTALTSLKVNLELGFSNTVFESGTGLYYPYNSSGEIETDSSNFMSLKLPFRYQADLEMEISTPLSLKLSLPVYSDPYFDWDFNQRAETMDWIDYMMSGGQSDSDEDDATTTGDFNWTLTGSYSFKVSEIVKPFISSASISSFSSSIKYSTKTISSYTGSSTSPERSFYYPSQITPFKISGKISGTIFEYPSSSSSSASSPSKVTLNAPEILDNSEKKTEETPSEETAGDDKKTDVSITVENIEEEKKVLDESALPVIATPSFTVQKISGLTYKLSYSVSPDFTSQISYDSSSISTPEDFSWSDMQSTYYQVKAPATLTSSLGLRDGFLSLSDTFTFNPVYQEHPYIKIKENDSDSGYTESAAQNVKKTDYSARKLDLTDVNAVTLKPFYYTEHFSDTSLTWNTTVKMIRTKYVSDDVENPEWEDLTTDLTDEECLTVHNLNLKLAAKEGNYNQSLTLTTTLPPQVDSYSGTISFGFPYATLSATTGIKQKSSTDDTWVK